MIKKLLVLCAAGLLSNAQANLITNGDFSAGLAGWTVTSQAGSNGTAFFLDTVGTTTPLSGQPTSAAGGGAGLYAVSDQTGAGATALTQSFTVAPGSSLTLSFDLFANDISGAGPLGGALGLDYTAGANQHARVDILTAGASALSTAPADIIATILAPFVDPFASNPNPFTHYSFDITPFVGGGGTFQIRFAEVDNQLFFNMGVDNVRIPEPGTLALLGLGLAGLAATRRRKQ